MRRRVSPAELALSLGEYVARGYKIPRVLQEKPNAQSFAVALGPLISSYIEAQGKELLAMKFIVLKHPKNKDLYKGFLSERRAFMRNLLFLEENVSALSEFLRNGQGTKVYTRSWGKALQLQYSKKELKRTWFPKKPRSSRHKARRA